MKRHLAVAFLLALATPAHAHDWYHGLTQPGTGRNCCNNQDCEPVASCVRDDGQGGIVINGHCRAIEWGKVLELPSPDGEAHACWSRTWPTPHDAPIFCIVLGGQA